MKLTRVMELEEKISSTRDELESLRAKATAPSTSKLDGLPRGRATTSRVEMMAIKIEAAERELAAMAAEYQAESARLSHEILSRVWPRNSKAGDVLFQRFLLGKSITEIAAEMKCTPSHVSHLTTAGRKILEGNEPQKSKQGVSPKLGTCVQNWIHPVPVGRCAQNCAYLTLVADDRQSRAAQSNETAKICAGQGG